jgi:FkbM family methyltransferase
MSKIAYYIYNNLIVKNADLFYRIKKLLRFKVHKTTLYGKPIKCIDISAFYVMKKEIMEVEIYRFNSSVKNPYILDCGANIGLSVIYFKRLYPQAQITTFEADPDICKILAENVAAQGINDVTIVNKAVWNEETTLTFFKEGGDGGRIEEARDGRAAIKVPTTRLKPYMDRDIDFLKIDIEGAEYEVLKDISPDLSRVKNIFVEYHSFVGQAQHLDEILAILSKAGFRYYIQTVGIFSHKPFVRINQSLGMDIQMNISGYRS